MSTSHRIPHSQKSAPSLQTSSSSPLIIGSPIPLIARPNSVLQLPSRTRSRNSQTTSPNAGSVRKYQAPRSRLATKPSMATLQRQKILAMMDLPKSAESGLFKDQHQPRNLRLSDMYKEMQPATKQPHLLEHQHQLSHGRLKYVGIPTQLNLKSGWFLRLKSLCLLQERYKFLATFNLTFHLLL